VDLEKFYKQFLSAFQQECEKILEDACSLPNNQLYHYTSFSNFQRIINNQILCFRDYRHLNDPTEILLSSNILKELIEEKIKKSVHPFWKEFSDIFYSVLDKEEFDKIKDRFIQIELIENNIYTFSLCSAVDSLPLWRWYGGNGVGISIGFRSEYFQPITDNELIEDNKKPRAACLKINYEKEYFVSIITRLLEIVEENLLLLMSFCEQNSVHFEDFLLKKGKFLAESVSCFLPLMPGFKHHGYKEEQEYRLYYMQNKITYKVECNREPDYFPYEIPGEYKKTRGLNIKEVSPEIASCLISLNSTKINYVEHHFLLDDIAEIWIGPCLDFECTKEQIIKILKYAEYDVNKIDTKAGIKIKKSEVPYR